MKKQKYRKRCPGCKENKLSSDFYSNSCSHDQLDSYCKKCKNARSKTAQVKNQPSRLKAWADATFSMLHLTDADY